MRTKSDAGRMNAHRQVAPQPRASRTWPSSRTPSVTTSLAPPSRGDTFRGPEVPSITVTTCSAKASSGSTQSPPKHGTSHRGFQTGIACHLLTVDPNTQTKRTPSCRLLSLLPPSRRRAAGGSGPCRAAPGQAHLGPGKHAANGTSRDPWLGRDYALIEHRQRFCTLIALRQQVLTPLLACIILPSVVVAIHLVLFSLVTD